MKQGDKVYYLHGNQIYGDEIHSTEIQSEIKITRDGVTTDKYEVMPSYPSMNPVSRKDLYLTPEEAQKSWIDKRIKEIKMTKLKVIQE